MNVQVLIATMNQSDYSLLDRMGIYSDTVVSNQCDRNHIESIMYKGFSSLWLDFREKGVGLNRNNALMRAKGDICLFADDDEYFLEGYERIIKQSFDDNPNADVIIFNVYGRDSGRNFTKKKKRVGYFNFLRFGAVRIAVRLKRIRENGIFFNLEFGGGTNHSHGEDNLFLSECLKKGLRIIAVPEFIARLDDNSISTWRNGFNDKYFMDQGFLYRKISRRFWLFLCIQDAVRRRKQYCMSPYVTLKKMIIGAK